VPEFKGRGFKIHYVEQGDGPPIVFVHGIVFDHTMYEAQFEDLPDRYRCIALDLRGHGHSEAPRGPWTMQDCVDDVIAFIEGVDATPCHLVGLSWGGMIGVRIAVQRPELLRSVVLLDTSAGAERPDLAELERGFISMIQAQGMSDDVIGSSVPVMFGQRYVNEHEDGITVYYDRLRTMDPNAVVDALGAIIERDSVLDRLGEIKMPVLVIHGEQDAAIPIAEAEAIAAGIAGAELVRVPDAGHMTPLEAPDAVNVALAEFLARAG
jgi:pimeloyl-ACP methyl ester carboxylesterase